MSSNGDDSKYFFFIFQSLLICFFDILFLLSLLLHLLILFSIFSPSYNFKYWITTMRTMICEFSIAPIGSTFYTFIDLSVFYYQIYRYIHFIPPLMIVKLYCLEFATYSIFQLLYWVYFLYTSYFSTLIMCFNSNFI